MKTFYDILLDQNPKTIQKVQKALGNGCGGEFIVQFRDEFIASLGRGDFANVQLAVTPNFLCDYSGFNMLFGGTIRIIPMHDIKNVYRTNIVNGEYSYEFFYLAVETFDNRRINLAQVPRNTKNDMEIFNPVIQAIRYEASKFRRTP